MPPWKAGEDVLMAHRVRASHVFERARSSTPAVPDNVPKKEKRYWQRIRDQDPPLHIRDFDVALGDHLQSKDDLPLEEEVHDSARGHQDIAVDEKGNVADPPLLDYQHHIHGSVVGPLYPPHLEREDWADMVDEAGDIPVETINYPGGHCAVPSRSARALQEDA